jgi:predicted nucleic acid-binding protein
MAIVIDANIAIAYAFDDERDERIERIVEIVAEDGAVVPAIWPSEVCNGLLVGRRRKRPGSEAFDEYLRVLEALPIHVEEDAPTIAALLDLATQTNLSAYDASYLEVAQRRRLALATLDDDVADAARHRGLRVIGR